MALAGKQPFSPIEELTRQIEHAGRTWLFLDYDGTLAEFAPTPADVLPDQELIGLLAQLAKNPKIRLTILSGRRLDQIQELVPIPGILLAGTYGLEIQDPNGQIYQRVSSKKIQAVIKNLKSLFNGLLAGLNGFYLEDKGWALAIHAKFADPEETVQVLNRARWLAMHYSPEGMFHFSDGDRFFEVSPQAANKARTVEFLLKQYPWPSAELVYLGDDAHDEEAFVVIQHYGGHSVLVGDQPYPSIAEYHIDSPGEVKAWLGEIERS